MGDGLVAWTKVNDFLTWICDGQACCADMCPTFGNFREDLPDTISEVAGLFRVTARNSPDAIICSRREGGAEHELSATLKITVPSALVTGSPLIRRVVFLIIQNINSLINGLEKFMQSLCNDTAGVMRPVSDAAALSCNALGRLSYGSSPP